MSIRRNNHYSEYPGLILVIFVIFVLNYACKNPNQPAPSTLPTEHLPSEEIPHEEEVKPALIETYHYPGYSIKLFSRPNEDRMLFPVTLYELVIENKNGTTHLNPSDDFIPYLEHGITPLEPELPGFFMIKEYNTGNCCRCNSYYVYKINAREVKYAGKCNGFENGEFYYYECYWPHDQPHAAMEFEKMAVPLVGDSLGYGEGFRF